MIPGYNLDDGAQRLLFILTLPLVDGVFATLLVAGALQTFSDVVTIALTIFTGAGALAVLYSESESTSEAKNLVYSVTPYLIAGAFLVGLIAPVFEQVFIVEQMKVAAGLALIVIAMEMADIGLAEKITVPGIIITGLMLSIREYSALSITLNYVVPAVATALAASVALYIASYLNREIVSLKHIRLGGSLVLIIIALNLFGLNLPSELALFVLIGSFFSGLDYNRLDQNSWKVLISN